MRKLKTERNTLILTGIVILLPVLAGVLLWNRLPERVPTHFNFSGEADGWSSRAFAVFGMPLILLAVHLLAAVVTAYDPKEQGVSEKIYRMILWIIPVLCVFVFSSLYLNALGYPHNMTGMAKIFTGLLFIIIGNYMPKVRQNMTVGIKIPWTLSDAENWNRTHRLAGRLYIIAGFLVIVTAFLSEGPAMWILITSILICTLCPIIYSFLIYRNSL